MADPVFTESEHTADPLFTADPMFTESESPREQPRNLCFSEPTLAVQITSPI